jgi:hypothetical protein
MSKKSQAAQTQQSNREIAQERMFAEIDELATTEGVGANARAILGVRCVEWSAGGDADVGDAKPIYERYISHVADASNPFGGLRIKGDKESGTKQNVSKFRQFLKMGGLRTIDPVSVIHRAQGVVKEERLKGTIAYGPFDALLNIARRQCVQTQSELTRDEMIDCNLPKDHGDITEADSLGRIKASIAKHEDTFGESIETTTAGENINARIEALGGTTAQKKQKERAEKAAAKKTKKSK